MITQTWSFKMLGGFEVRQGDLILTRFRTRKAASLLAYLACYPEREHARDELVSRFWPGDDQDAGRSSLRVVLSALRRQLDAPMMPAGTILLANRTTVTLRSELVTTDVAAFDSACRVSLAAADAFQSVTLCERAIALYRGELLPGDREPWVLYERQRLQGRLCSVLGRLSRLYSERGDLEGALQCGARMVAERPLHEETRHEQIRLLLSAGMPEAAREQYRELAGLLCDLGRAPSPVTRALLQQLNESPLNGRPLPGPRGGITSFPANAPLSQVSKAGSPSKLSTKAQAQAEASTDETSISSRVRLPRRYTRFYGREAEIRALLEMLGDSEAAAMVTITGVAGVGKTRLAVEVAEQWSKMFPDRAYFVSLVGLMEPRHIVEAVRDVLRLPRAVDQDPIEQIAATIGETPTLLLLDNYEHLLPDGAVIALRLLEAMPCIRLLITSRRSLELYIEREIPLLPLPLPEEDQGRGKALRADAAISLLSCPSVQLFADRARGRQPGFQITSGNADAVAALCRRLDGLPLAIELASARSGALTPQEMLAQTDDRFRLLVSRHSDLPERHRSLYAAISASYEALMPELRRVFAHLSVFRGGWTLEAATAVVMRHAISEQTPISIIGSGETDLTTVEMSETLHELRTHSLVIAEPHEGGTRYRLLESLREFAEQQLTHEERSDLHGRHADYFHALAARAELFAERPEAAEWYDLLEADLDNLRAAMDWTLQVGRCEQSLSLASALLPLWDTRGYRAEGFGRLQCRLALVPEPILTRAKALYAAALLAGYLGKTEVRGSYLEESLRLFRLLGDDIGIGLTLQNIALVRMGQSDYTTAENLLEEALAAFIRVDERGGIAWALHFLGTLALGQYKHELARSYYERSLTIREAMGDQRAIAYSLLNIGAILRLQNDLAAARSYIERSQTLFAAVGDPSLVAIAGLWLGTLCDREGRYNEAECLLSEALETLRARNVRVHVALCLMAMGDLRRHQGDVYAAEPCYREGVTILREIKNQRHAVCALAPFALLARQMGDFTRAAWLFGAAGTLRDQLGVPSTPYESVEVDPALTATREALGNARFSDSFDSGRAVTLAEAIAVALREAVPVIPS